MSLICRNAEVKHEKPIRQVSAARPLQLRCFHVGVTRKLLDTTVGRIRRCLRELGVAVADFDVVEAGADVRAARDGGQGRTHKVDLIH
jgi:hypothetical protein